MANFIFNIETIKELGFAVAADVKHSSIGVARMSREMAGVASVAAVMGTTVSADYVAQKTNQFAQVMNKKSHAMGLAIMARHAQRNSRLAAR